MILLKYDICIIGGGVIGLSIAYHLSKDLSVCIIDRNTRGMNASLAAGGMLGAQNEFYEDTPLYRFSLYSRSIMPRVVRNLEDKTGINIHYKKHGLIKYLTDLSSMDALMKQYSFLKSQDKNVQLLNSDGLKSVHASINNQSMGIYIPDDAQVDAIRYVAALKAALSHVTMRTAEVLRTDKSDGYIVHTTRGQVRASKIVIAGGAWSGDIRDVPLNVSGVRGEVAYMYHPTLKLKTTLFGTNGCYIVPKRHNHYLVGATSYYNDRKVLVSQQGKDWLRHNSSFMCPELKNAKVITHWSGIRPHTNGHNLYMDEVQKGMYIATGHYRNGILLSAATGEYMARLIEDNISSPHFTLSKIV